MARRKKADTEKFDEKKMESAYDFGSVKVPTSWEEVTLQMMCDYLKLSADKEEQLKKDKAEARKDKEKKIEIDEKDEKYNITDKDLLQIFTDFDMSKYDILPVELYNSIMSNFSFVMSEMDSADPTNELFYNNMHFVINDMESLKVKEYEDAEMVIRNNMYDYPSLLAVLCREVTGRKTDHVTGLTYLVNEDYDSEFSNKFFEARREMFANMPITKAMPLVSYFFIKGIEYSNLSQNSIQTIAHQLLDLVQNLEDSVKCTAFLNPSSLLRMMTLRKYKKSIKRILSSSSTT